MCTFFTHAGAEHGHALDGKLAASSKPQLPLQKLLTRSQLRALLELAGSDPGEIDPLLMDLLCNSLTLLHAPFFFPASQLQQPGT